MKKVLMLVSVVMFMAVGCITKVVQVEDTSPVQPFKIYFNLDVSKSIDTNHVVYLYRTNPPLGINLDSLYRAIPNITDKEIQSYFPKPFDSVKYNKDVYVDLPDGTMIYFNRIGSLTNIKKLIVYHDHYIELSQY